MVNSVFYNELIFVDPPERLYQALINRGYKANEEYIPRDTGKVLLKNHRLNHEFEAFELGKIKEAEVAIKEAMERVNDKTREYTRQLTLLRLNRQRFAMKVAQEAAAEAKEEKSDER